MERCSCCNQEARKIRPFQRIWMDESSEVGLCSNCFTEAVQVGQEIRDLSGSISLEIAKGEKSIGYQLQDGRRVLIQILEGK